MMIYRMVNSYTLERNLSTEAFASKIGSLSNDEGDDNTNATKQ